MNTNRVEKIITADSKQLAAKGAQIFCKTAKETIALQGRFAVAVSGGSTPRAMHRLMSQEPYLSDIPWQKTHIFWVDERMVAFDHPDSNFGTAKKDFLNIIPIPSDQVYPIPVMTRPEKAAALYQAKLKTFFHDMSSDDPVFDLILLGIGKDGHVASLFPGRPQIKEANRWVLSVKGGQPNIFRLTLNYTVLNNARQILFLVSGSGKAAIVKTLLENSQAQLPAVKIRPPNGRVIWLLDQAAASLLSG
ncbi:MAG: 6-phosphogluconolactonase [Desulfobacteraceae bacterium]|nr:MAG: 6-phosphogluconolactonase [Desulfobacteraceae bacterium]